MGGRPHPGTARGGIAVRPSYGPAPRTLAGLPGGSRGIIGRIPVEDAGIAAELAALRILPGEPVEVLEVIPFSGPLLIRTRGGVYALGRELADRITVAGEP